MSPRRSGWPIDASDPLAPRLRGRRGDRPLPASRYPEFPSQPLSSPQATGVFGVPAGVPNANFRPQLTDTKKPEVLYLPDLRLMSRVGLEPTTYGLKVLR